MADNQTVDNGDLTDFTVVADEITSPYTGGAAKAEGVKILAGQANANEPIGGDAANGLDVDVTRVQGTVSVNPSGETAGVGVGAAADAEATGNGSVIAILKRIRTLLAGTLTVSGSVGVTGALPAGGNTIGNVVVTGSLPAGTNNIGDVDVLSIPASTKETDGVAAYHGTDAIMAGSAALTPKFKSATVAASQTDSVLVAGVTSKKIRVLALAVQVGGTATDVTFESNDTVDVRLHKVPAGANGGQILPFNPVGWFETGAGLDLIVTTGAGSSVEITLTYIEV